MGHTGNFLLLFLRINYKNNISLFKIFFEIYMNKADLSICFLLISLFTTAIGGMFLVKNYIKKISLLSVAYVSFVILFFILAQNKILAKEAASLVAVIFTVFSINLLVGIGLVKNISGGSKR